MLFNGSSIGNKLIVLLPAPINPFVVELIVEAAYGPVAITMSVYNCTELPPPPNTCNTQVRNGLHASLRACSSVTCSSLLLSCLV
jgi:hypothetical protein